jgi:hypothetical protein
MPVNQLAPSSCERLAEPLATTPGELGAAAWEPLQPWALVSVLLWAWGACQKHRREKQSRKWTFAGLRQRLPLIPTVAEVKAGLEPVVEFVIVIVVRETWHAVL